MLGGTPERPSSFVLAVGGLLMAALVATPTVAHPHEDEECSPYIDVDGPRLYLPANEDATVTGHHDWSANTSATIVLQFGDDQSPTGLRNDSVRVHDDRWKATFDLSAVEEGRTFVARLGRDGRVIDTAAGEVGNASATMTFENQTASGSPAMLTIQRVHLDLGGFVAIHDDSHRGPIVGFSRYLPPGTHENVDVELDATMSGQTRLVAVAHLDSDCDEAFQLVIRDEDGPYVENGTARGPEADAATVRVSTPMPSPSPTATSLPSSPGSPEPDAPTDSAARTTTTLPGVGVGATLVALAGGLVVLWRKR